jgi:hypothetical protein
MGHPPDGLRIAVARVTSVAIDELFLDGCDYLTWTYRPDRSRLEV